MRVDNASTQGNDDIAVVCGATGGLGPSVVRAFAGRGDRVIAVARSREELERLVAAHPGQVRGEPADLTQAAEVDRLWERIDAAGDPPRWVVNVTGGFRGGKLVDSRVEDFTAMLELNLASAWWSCRAAASRLQKHGGGAIVNVGSRSALVHERGAAAYAVSKAAVVKLTQVLAEELKETGIRVNAVVPAVIDTPTNRKSMPPELLKKAVAPESIARVIAFLCSEAAGVVTGAVVPVYGRF